MAVQLLLNVLVVLIVSLVVVSMVLYSSIIKKSGTNDTICGICINGSSNNGTIL